MKTGMRLEAGTPKFEFFLSFGKAARGVKASTAEKLWDALSLDINPSDDSGCAKMANHLETLIFQYYDWKGVGSQEERQGGPARPRWLCGRA